MIRKPPFGTAEKEVLLKLTTPKRMREGLTSWSQKDGTALYDNRAMTEAVCQRLAALGLVDHAVENGANMYQVNSEGFSKANWIRLRGDFGPLHMGTED